MVVVDVLRMLYRSDRISGGLSSALPGFAVGSTLGGNGGFFGIEGGTCRATEEGSWP